MLGVDVDLVMKGVLTNPYLARSCSTPWSDLVSAVSCWLASHPAVRLHVVDPAVVVAATRLPESFHAH
jgi:hypothetical protein